MSSGDSAAVGDLVVGFEGYFACRIATDPDPTDEPRGMSGYTLALAREDPLDQRIRLQIDEPYLASNARPPLREMFRNREFLLGVKVRSVTYGGQPWAQASELISSPVELGGGDTPFVGPIFDSRNAITGNDDQMAFVVYPFNLRIGRGGINALSIATVDNLPPLWSMPDPRAYAHRISCLATSADEITEVSEAVGVYDTYGYFRDRRRYLAKLIAEAEAQIAAGEGDRALLEEQIEGYRSRIHQLEFWGDRMISKLQTRCNWEFPIDGPRTVSGNFGGSIDTAAPWRTRFWFGGWDGDLLIGYMRGTLSMPFRPGDAP